MGGAEAPADPVEPARADVLAGKGGDRGREARDRHEGEGVDPARDAPAGHEGRAVAVDEPLDDHGADREEHELDAGREADADGLGEEPAVEAQARRDEVGEPEAEDDPGRAEEEGDGLRDDRGPGDPRHPPAEADDEEEVERDVEDGRDGEEDEGGHRVAEALEYAGVEVVAEGPDDPGEDDREVGRRHLHRGPRGGVEELEEGPHRDEADEGDGDRPEQGHDIGGVDRRAEALAVFRAEELAYDDGETERKPRKERDDEEAYDEGAPDRGEGLLPDEVADHEGVDEVVELLEGVAGEQGQGKPDDVARGAAFGHGYHGIILTKRSRAVERPPIYVV